MVWHKLNDFVKVKGLIMGSRMDAIETIGPVEDQTHLALDEPMQIADKSKVRVIILPPDETDISEKEWLKAAYNNPAFDFLKDNEEDIYSISDGTKFSS
ncbi:MAG: hypothetical protein ACUZ8H_07420 [Candidatus Anammoxibacter sp.]